MTIDTEGIFKFKIGDRVRHRGSPTGRAQIIIERSLLECYGGIQLHYHLRDSFPYGGNLGNGIVVVTEPELIPDRPVCEGCMYGIPIQASPGMKGGFAHIDDRQRQSCDFGRTA